MRTLILLGLTFPICVLAAPEDRGLRGWYVGGGGGAVIGSAADEDGRSAGGFFGSGGYFKVGDEAIPNLGVGLTFGGAGGEGNNDGYSTGFGGFFLELAWRALPETAPGLVLIGGTGVGGGTLEATGDDGFDGAPGGATYTLGATWEFGFGEGVDGFVISPAVRWLLMPAQLENDAFISAFVVGVETLWYAGR